MAVKEHEYYDVLVTGDVEDIRISDRGGTTKITFDYGGTEFSIGIDKKQIGQLSEKLHDHITKGGTDES